MTSIEAYESGRPNEKTLCIDIAATTRYTWLSGYDTRMMRHRTPTTGGSTDGMERIANSCAVCCQ